MVPRDSGLGQVNKGSKVCLSQSHAKCDFGYGTEPMM